jgi:transcriptional regulator with XRE-family HTH domain
MRQPKRTQKPSNPLKLLAKKLGSETKPISMEKIARLTDVAPATLRSVELGLRKFSPEIQQRMRQRGLEWDEKRSTWFFTYDHEADLTLPLLESFRRLSRGDDRFQDLDAHAMTEKLISLLQKVPVGAYVDLLLDLNATLDRLREAYEVEDAIELFKQRKLKYWVEQTPSGGQNLVKQYSWPNPPKWKELLNHSRLKKSKPMPGEDDDEEAENTTPQLVPKSAA